MVTCNPFKGLKDVTNQATALAAAAEPGRHQYWGVTTSLTPLLGFPYPSQTFRLAECLSRSHWMFVIVVVTWTSISEGFQPWLVSLIKSFLMQLPLMEIIRHQRAKRSPRESSGSRHTLVFSSNSHPSRESPLIMPSGTVTSFVLCRFSDIWSPEWPGGTCSPRFSDTCDKSSCPET